MTTNWQFLDEVSQKAPFGLISDFDGTLAPIVEVPADAQLTPSNRENLLRLQFQIPLIALISGRSVTDLVERVALPNLSYIGNHGYEYWQDGVAHFTPLSQAYQLIITQACQQIILEEGMRLENKGVTASIHYRQTANPDRVEITYKPYLQALADQYGLHLFQGRCVFELRPPLAINKGTAFQELIQTHQLKGAIYLGDDTTDLDAFRTARTLRQKGLCQAIGIGVLSEGMPPALPELADYLVEGVSGVEELLSALLNANKES